MPPRNRLNEACEVQLALSALPSRLRSTATVYALTDGKYRKAVQGEGPFTCIVERNHASSVAPQCMDREGARTILPALIAKGELVMQSASAEIAGKQYDELVENGNFEPAARAGVSYMMSDYNYIYVPSADTVMKVPPHVMFYAPNLSNDDVGGSLESAVSNMGTPFIVNPGIHGFLITYAEHASDSNGVAGACAGEMGDTPPRFNPFPQEQ
jgi:hypothetical protein